MFFVVRSNDSFNFPLGWIKYIVIVMVNLRMYIFIHSHLYIYVNICVYRHTRVLVLAFISTFFFFSFLLITNLILGVLNWCVVWEAPFHGASEQLSVQYDAGLLWLVCFSRVWEPLKRGWGKLFTLFANFCQQLVYCRVFLPQCEDIYHAQTKHWKT